MADPSVQASYMKNSAAILARSGAPGAAVLGSDPSLFHLVGEAGRTAWLPISCNLRFVEAVERGVGWPSGLELIASTLVDQFETPLWRTLVQGGLRVLGREPAALARWLPTAVRLVFRDCGDWSVARLGPQRVEVRGADLPKELAEHRLWLEAMGAAAHALGRLCGTRGHGQLVEQDPVQRCARLVFDWESQPAR